VPALSVGSGITTLAQRAERTCEYNYISLLLNENNSVVSIDDEKDTMIILVSRNAAAHA
jgi:hypothetical protein